jgi:hypothetical protein
MRYLYDTMRYLYDTMRYDTMRYSRDMIQWDIQCNTMRYLFNILRKILFFSITWNTHINQLRWCEKS